MHVKFLVLFLALADQMALGQIKPSYTDTEAGKHSGEEATVTGKVFSVYTSSGGTTFLNFGARFPNHTFSGIIFSSKQAAVGDVKQYDGKEVEVTGRIELSKDQKPQIIVSSADQIKLAVPAKPPAPPTPPPAPVTPTPTTTTRSPAQETASSTTTSGNIGLGTGWNSSRRGGEVVRKDLAKLFGEAGLASEVTQVDTTLEIYPGVTFLTPFADARKALNIEGAQVKKLKISTPGFPQDSFSANIFEGVFPGGFTQLYLITDANDRVASVLLRSPGTGTRVTNEPDTMGYHTHNLVTGDQKGATHFVVRHQIVPGSATKGVVIVETMLINPTDPEVQPTAGRSTKSSSSKSSSYSKPKTGKVIERSRWHVPVSIVNLILRCVGG